jgi:transcriptional regulator of NAD metabolism
MTSKPFSHPQSSGKPPCKHPRVQIVSREEDAEFVECLECREIFEASELKDMSIEESTEGETQES